MKISDEMLYENAGKARDIWLGSLPKGRDIPEHRFSRGFERRMNALIRKQRRSPFINNMVQVFKWSAAIILITFILTVSAAMTVEAFRERVIEIVTKVFSDRTEYYFSTEETDLYIPEIEFGYIPEGMEQTQYEESPIYLYKCFEDKSGRFFEINCFTINDNSSMTLLLDTEDADTQTINQGGKEILSNSKGSDYTLMWTEDNVVYELYGNIGTEELLKIEESLKQKGSG